MRRKIYYILFLWLILIGGIGCSDGNDPLEDLKGEENNGGGPAENPETMDSVIFCPGRLRAKIVCVVPEKSSATKMRVYWSGKKESAETEVIPGKKAELLLSGLKEQAYTFRVCLLDAGEGEIASKEIRGRVYDKNYETTLTNREILKLKELPEGKYEVQWKPVNDKLLLRTEVVYQTADEQQKVLQLGKAENTLLLTDCADDEFSFYNVYKPDSLALDEFHSVAVRMSTVPVYDWSGIAEAGQKTMRDAYWTTAHYFRQEDNKENFNYWTNAQALDAELDGWERLQTDFYKQRGAELLAGIKKKNGNSFINDFYDDMEWLAISTLRAYKLWQGEQYKATADLLWEDIKTGWNDKHGGGIRWCKSADHVSSKNACSNGPAAIFAARYYLQSRSADHLEWAKKIFQWEKTHLVNENDGRVGDSMGNPTWLFSYNQGTYIGAAVELFRATGDRTYLDDAVKTANYTVGTDFCPDGILPNGGGSDGGMFNGICVRYLEQLINLPELSEELRLKYIRFLEKNAKQLLSVAGEQYRFGGNWRKVAEANNYHSAQASGVMLMEVLARLQQAYPDILDKYRY